MRNRKGARSSESVGCINALHGASAKFPPTTDDDTAGNGGSARELRLISQTLTCKGEIGHGIGRHHRGYGLGAGCTAIFSDLKRWILVASSSPSHLIGPLSAARHHSAPIKIPCVGGACCSRTGIGHCGRNALADGSGDVKYRRRIRNDGHGDRLFRITAVTVGGPYGIDRSNGG